MKKIIKYITLFLLSFYTLFIVLDVFMDLGVNYYQNKLVWMFDVLILAIFLMNKYAKQNRVAYSFRLSFLVSFLLWTTAYAIDRTGNTSSITDFLLSISTCGIIASFAIGIVAIFKK